MLLSGIDRSCTDDFCSSQGMGVKFEELLLNWLSFIVALLTLEHQISDVFPCVASSACPVASYLQRVFIGLGVGSPNTENILLSRSVASRGVSPRELFKVSSNPLSWDVFAGNRADIRRLRGTTRTCVSYCYESANDNARVARPDKGHINSTPGVNNSAQDNYCWRPLSRSVCTHKARYGLHGRHVNSQYIALEMSALAMEESRQGLWTGSYRGGQTQLGAADR